MFSYRQAFHAPIFYWNSRCIEASAFQTMLMPLWLAVKSRTIQGQDKACSCCETINIELLETATLKLVYELQSLKCYFFIYIIFQNNTYTM